MVAKQAPSAWRIMLKVGLVLAEQYLSDGSLANYTLGASKVPAFEDSACKRVIHSVDYRISTNEKGSIISVSYPNAVGTTTEISGR